MLQPKCFCGKPIKVCGRWKQSEFDSPKNRYKYNGKELVEEMGLKLFDYGWRNQDPILGRWWNVDKASNEYVSLSPYVVTANNPIKFVELDGKRFYFAVGVGHDPTWCRHLRRVQEYPGNSDIHLYHR